MSRLFACRGGGPEPTERQTLRIAHLDASDAGTSSARGDVQLVMEFTLGVDHAVLVDRLRRGSGPITNLEVLNLLIQLPAGRPCWVDWSKYELQLLRPHFGSALELNQRRGNHYLVTRWLEPAVEVQAVLISGARWDRAIAAASKYAPYCQRRVSVDELPGDEHLFWWEARLLGVGVVTSSGAELLEAAPFAPERYSGASWKFAEQMLASTDLASS